MSTDVPCALTTTELGGLRIFSGLSDDALGFLQRRLRCVQYEPGATVFSEGERGVSLFVLVGGEVEVVKQVAERGEVRVAVLKAGQWFGEMSVVDLTPRTASVRALCGVELLVVSSADLDALYRHDLRSYSLVVLNIARGLSRRMRANERELAEVLARR